MDQSLPGASVYRCRAGAEEGTLPGCQSPLISNIAAEAETPYNSRALNALPAHRSIFV